jgi:chromosomal replication initiator protein
MIPDKQQLWNYILARLETKLSRPTYETWIKPITVKKWHDNCLIISTPNPFILNHLQKNYLTTIADICADFVGKPVEIQLITASGEGESIAVFSDKKKTSQNPPTTTITLNPKYTFYRFVVGPNNRMAHAASLAVAESPGREFNPLFLCGGVGLGKTHLMQAIAHYRLEMYPDSKVFYVSTEQFTNDLITAIREDNMQGFREHYRRADILLVDDIQFIEGKEYTQEEFFHTFNALQGAGKQVVIASDRLPKQIPTLQERLISRFSMGLIADIQAPNLETRMAILQKKAEDEHIKLPKEVIEFIASSYTANIRELEGALTRAMAYTSISGLAMSVTNLAPILNPPTEKLAATPATIMNVCADALGVSREDLQGNSRKREISQARQIAMYLMRQHTDLSLPRIGEEFGGKDHTTVMYSCDKINRLIKKNGRLAQTVSQLSDRINFTTAKTTRESS